MAIKVIMGRTVQLGNRDALQALLRELRAKAVHQSGYIAGETLCSLQRPDTHLVISTWHSLQDWKSWENNPERLVLTGQIESLLISPSKVDAYIESSASVSWHSIPDAI